MSNLLSERVYSNYLTDFLLYLNSDSNIFLFRPSADFSSPSQRPKLPTEVNNKFGNRLVAGDSVSKFNDLVDTLLVSCKVLIFYVNYFRIKSKPFLKTVPSYPIIMRNSLTKQTWLTPLPLTSKRVGKFVYLNLFTITVLL